MHFPFFAKSGNAFERMVLGGWELSGVTFVQIGIPQPINYNGADTLGLGGGTSNRPNLVAAISYPKTRLAWFNKSFFCSSNRPLGNGRTGIKAGAMPQKTQSSCRDSSTSTWPFSRLSHSQKRSKFQFRLETFNTFNHTEFQRHRYWLQRRELRPGDLVPTILACCSLAGSSRSDLNVCTPKAPGFNAMAPFISELFDGSAFRWTLHALQRGLEDPWPSLMVTN